MSHIHSHDGINKHKQFYCCEMRENIHLGWVISANSVCGVCVQRITLTHSLFPSKVQRKFFINANSKQTNKQTNNRQKNNQTNKKKHTNNIQTDKQKTQRRINTQKTKSAQTNKYTDLYLSIHFIHIVATFTFTRGIQMKMKENCITTSLHALPIFYYFFISSFTDLFTSAFLYKYAYITTREHYYIFMFNKLIRNFFLLLSLTQN